jgi:hypothetical protein
VRWVMQTLRIAGVEVIANEVSSRETPSLVTFTSKERAIGEASKTAVRVPPAAGFKHASCHRHAPRRRRRRHRHRRPPTHQFVKHPKTTVTNMKRCIGRKFKELDESEAQFLSHKISEGPNGEILADVSAAVVARAVVVQVPRSSRLWGCCEPTSRPGTAARNRSLRARHSSNTAARTRALPTRALPVRSSESSRPPPRAR